MTHVPAPRALFVWATLAVAFITSDAAAQPIGTFRWQLQPYCNVVTLAVTQNGGLFTLDGTDDQCGAGPAASALGTAFFNHDGSVGIGLHLVAAPGASPLHVTVVLNTATLSGTWTDSAGHAGAFLFNPTAPAAGSPRPPGGGLNGVAVTSVVAGAGLAGGGITGPVNLSVAFGGSGAAATAARSDHTHAIAGFANTSVGSAAMAASSGGANTALGFEALRANATGGNNTAVGALALRSSEASANTAVGVTALFGSTTGNFNTAVGESALRDSVSGNDNTAVGVDSLRNNVSGSGNVAVGYHSGSASTTGNDNIYLGSLVAGLPNESQTIRLGRTSGAAHLATYVGGIYASTVNGATDLPVLIDSTGKLGTSVSSARAKQDMRDLGAGGPTGIERLRPVSFRYRPEQGRGDGLQYGLIAEQVAETMPALVVRDENGVPVSVRYHQLPPLLVAEVQRLDRLRIEQEAAILALREEVAALRDRHGAVLALERRLAELERALTTPNRP